MNKHRLLVLASLSITLANCAPSGPPTAGNYRTGSDVAMIKDSRNRRESVTSEAELHQHRIQRTDVSEEMDLDEKKRRASTGGLRTAYEATGLIGGTLRNIRSF